MGPDLVARNEKGKRKSSGHHTKGNGLGPTEHSPFSHDRAYEQHILKETIEAQIAASSVHTECWEKVMDPMRKVILGKRVDRESTRVHGYQMTETVGAALAKCDFPKPYKIIVL